MKKSKTSVTKRNARPASGAGYDRILREVVGLLESARHASARAVNAVMTATYWEIGRRIVEQEQQGKKRAEYGKQLLKQLSADLTAKYKRGFSPDNLETMRLFYLTYPQKGISETVSRKSDQIKLAERFPLPWSHYVMLVRRTRSPEARAFYETEALRGGWSVRQLDRQINSLFYERTALSRNKAAMLTKGAQPKPEDRVTPEEEIKDPFVLEFLGRRDEYSESELEEAILQHIEKFLLELGSDFAFVGRQRRVRVGDDWYRIDLLFYHRRLRCLLIIDLKSGKLIHADIGRILGGYWADIGRILGGYWADIGQMHFYCNYAHEHWTLPGENPPVGLILCADRNEAMAQYALDGLSNKILAAEYRVALPDEKLLVAEIEKTRRAVDDKKALRPKRKK